MISVHHDVKMAVESKLRVLRDFYVVDIHNEERIRRQLFKAVEDEPNKDFNTVLDRVAKQLITEKLNSVS